MTLERARTDYHKEEEVRIQYPHTLHALQNLIMAIVDYQKNQGKFSFFGKDKGLKAYQKFMESIRDTRDAMIIDKVIDKGASQSDFQGKLLENIVVFSTIYPNWQDAYKYAFEYFGSADVNTKQSMIFDSDKNALINIDKLASRLLKQREIWLKSVHSSLQRKDFIGTKYNLSILPALPIISSFQFVHVSHFINLKKYVDENNYNEYFSKLSDLLCTKPIDEWLSLVKQHESNMTSFDMPEQMVHLCEDVTIAIMGSSAGMIYGPAFAPMAKEFVKRNLAIVADHFGDKSLAKKLSDIF